MSRFWSDTVHRLTPYVPGEQPQVRQWTKLNTNENPYPPSPRALDAMRQDLAGDGDALRLYPEPTGKAVREAVSRRLQLPADQVFVGNGSDEVLAHVFVALLRHADSQGRPRPLLFPDITYGFYTTYCGLYDITYRQPELDDHFRVNLDDYRSAEDAGAIILPNPNAPTGQALSLAEVESLVDARSDIPVVIDEAYVDFGAESAASLISRHPNLLVVQTLSKSRALAGLRVGFALGQPELIEGLIRAKDSFNSYPLDRLAQLAAAAALDDEAHFEQTRQAVMRSRDWLGGQLQSLGFEVLPSLANFVFARHPARSGPDLAAALREQGILVRRFDRPERIKDFLRISIGTDAQCQALVAALNQILSGAA